MWLISEQMLDHLSGKRSSLSSPINKAVWCPLAVSAMSLGHVIGLGGMRAFALVSLMHGNALPAIETFDHSFTDANIDLPFDQRVRHAVIMTGYVYMIIKMHAGTTPFGIFVRLFWQRQQRCSFKLIKLARTRARQFLEWSL